VANQTVKLPAKLIELAANVPVYRDPEGHFRLELPRGLTASAASAEGWRKIGVTRKQRADIERSRLRRAITDNARAELAAAVGAPLPSAKQRNRKARRDFNGRAGR